MPRFLDELDKACRNSWYAAIGGPFLKYVKSGDEAVLENLKKQVGEGAWQLEFLKGIWPHLGPPQALSPEEKRAMHGVAELGAGELLAGWLAQKLERHHSDEEAFLSVFLEAFGTNAADRIRAAAALIHSLGDALERGGGPNAAGRFLLALSDKDLAAAGERASRVHQALAFLVRHAPQRLPAVAGSFLREGEPQWRCISPEACQILLTTDAKAFESLVAGAVAKEKGYPGRAARVLELLAAHFPETYVSQAREVNLKIVAKPADNISAADVLAGCRWLLDQFGPAVLPDLERHFSSDQLQYQLGEILNLVAEKLGPAGTRSLIAATGHQNHEARLIALSHLIVWNEPANDGVIRPCLESGLTSEYPKLVVRYIGLAGRWQPQALETELWKLIEHKSKPVRQAAARALARIGDPAVAKADELLAAKKSAVRSTAVTLLAVAETPAAAKALEARVDEETDEEVRDQILLALEQVWEAQGKKITRTEIDCRIERAADRLQTPVARWLNEKKLPVLQYAGKPGGNLSREAVRYLLYRQSRAKEMRADVEAKPLFALIDRKTSGDFALTVFEMFCGSATAAEDRWALAVAGLLGDDRIVPPLMQQIRKWIDNNRGKLAEYAAQALALLGSDVALCAVDSISIRYRSKQKNVGKAASEAFAEAAERMGLAVDELGDRVVPWLGFEPGKPRLIAEGDKRIEVRIGTDFKLEFRDLAKNKTITSLPGGISADVKAEFKDLGATLREVLKGQLPRLENLMVRQYRWPIARWRELYLVHPLLFPFTTRLVWGLYGGEGRLQTLFRALEDRTLTDEKDESIELPTGDGQQATIGIVHPLELSGERRQGWMTHLADYNVTSPFLQMERPVLYPAADELEVKFSSKFAGMELNGLTFKGRAERLGWYRGSVIDAGCILYYCKSFPGAGADALLSLDGMYVGIDMYSSIKLERLFFVKTGSVNFGNYVYDEPSDAKDERLLPFGQVPPIVFSETLGDLGKIAGKKDGIADIEE